MTVHDAGGNAVAVWESLDDLTPVGDDLYLADFRTGVPGPLPFRLTINETWGATAADFSTQCSTSTSLDFVAGGPLPRGPAPGVRAQAFFGSPTAAPWRRRIQQQVFSNFGISSRFNVRVTVRCPVIDDGLGHPIKKPASLRVRLPVRSGVQRWTPCVGGPTALPAGSSELVIKTFTGPIQVRAARAGRRSSRWRVELDQWQMVRSGRLELRHSKYRPALSRRIYDTDFDPYINICINEGRRLWASGGRLYCTVQVQEESSVATLRIRP